MPHRVNPFRYDSWSTDLIGLDGVRRAVRRSVATVVLVAAFGAGASGQTPLTLEEAMKRAQGATVDARALASTVDEAEARVDQAHAKFWPRVDFTESVQRGNNPVYAFSALLSRRRFTAANFAIPALDHPDPVTNTRSAIAIEQPIFNAGRTTLGIEAAKLGRER